LKKVFQALAGAIAGALIGSPLLAVGLAVLFSENYGAFEGAAAMGGASLGGVGGLVLGAGLGIWLVVRKDGKHALVTLLSLWGVAILTILIFAAVAFD
jgi:hypothetical protein